MPGKVPEPCALLLPLLSLSLCLSLSPSAPPVAPRPRPPSVTRPEASNDTHAADAAAATQGPTPTPRPKPKPRPRPPSQATSSGSSAPTTPEPMATTAPQPTIPEQPPASESPSHSHSPAPDTAADLNPTPIEVPTPAEPVAAPPTTLDGGEDDDDDNYELPDPILSSPGRGMAAPPAAAQDGDDEEDNSYEYCDTAGLPINPSVAPSSLPADEDEEGDDANDYDNLDEQGDTLPPLPPRRVEPVPEVPSRASRPKLTPEPKILVRKDKRSTRLPPRPSKPPPSTPASTTVTLVTDGTPPPRPPKSLPADADPAPIASNRRTPPKLPNTAVSARRPHGEDSDTDDDMDNYDEADEMFRGKNQLAQIRVDHSSNTYLEPQQGQEEVYVAKKRESAICRTDSMASNATATSGGGESNPGSTAPELPQPYAKADTDEEEGEPQASAAASTGLSGIAEAPAGSGGEGEGEGEGAADVFASGSKPQASTGATPAPAQATKKPPTRKRSGGGLFRRKKSEAVPEISEEDRALLDECKARTETCGQGRVTKAPPASSLHETFLPIALGERLEILEMSRGPSGVWVCRNANKAVGFVNNQNVEMDVSSVRLLLEAVPKPAKLETTVEGLPLDMKGSVVGVAVLSPEEMAKHRERHQAPAAVAKTSTDAAPAPGTDRDVASASSSAPPGAETGADIDESAPLPVYESLENPTDDAQIYDTADHVSREPTMYADADALALDSSVYAAANDMSDEEEGPASPTPQPSLPPRPSPRAPALPPPRGSQENIRRVPADTRPVDGDIYESVETEAEPSNDQAARKRSLSPQPDVYESVDLEGPGSGAAETETDAVYESMDTEQATHGAGDEKDPAIYESMETAEGGPSEVTAASDTQPDPTSNMLVSEDGEIYEDMSDANVPNSTLPPSEAEVLDALNEGDEVYTAMDEAPVTLRKRYEVVSTTEREGTESPPPVPPPRRESKDSVV
ncbi:uncharacterized protein MONBRDRAFT_30104 [Monosiga brevicollis MX1]|uniref:SH3 domain-containing protein n=1 Tax=Monosiga brevicollis TaxID=81824 RepID=A9VD15_MONBE|nr:uncharacterized protein MONBRDRAFT_30104 [Monosiga brevicollis MX1]EDQ84563.1 predicted protein [Monosiga brevicollis MX1]|eukprot:XP_001750590.1 hypothetical protein [Monosiga brevicollis MX1]